ncbi:MAG: LytR C-terminal domain-containing protein, partial [Fidelibacterota bacterium]
TEIEILNGCGIPGVASKFTDYLRRKGYDVVRFTNAQRYDYPRTLVVNRGEDLARAYSVAQALGVEANAVENMPDPSLQLDVTVVLGQDFNTLTSYRELMSSRR